MRADDILGRIWTAIFIVLAVVVVGCAPEVTAPAPLCSYLPQPAISRVDRGPLTEEAALRKCEADHLVAERYHEQGYRIVATTQTYSGQVIDWMAAESVPGSEKEPPPPIDLSNLHLPPGVQLGKTELELYSELQGPVDTVPVARTTFSAYVHGETQASSLEELLEQSEPQSGAPGMPDRLYTGYKLHVESMGSVADVNAFSGPPIELGTMSLMEMAVTCHDKDNPDATLQLVGIAASRDHANFYYSPEDARQLRLQVEFLTQGEHVTGPEKGGWHGSGVKYNTGFRMKSNSTVNYPGVLMLASTMGGAQYEHRFQIQRFNGDWWLALNGEWFGYYPASLFTRMRDYACDVLWYTEVADKEPTIWTQTDAGSGEFAAAGFGKAAYFRRIYYADRKGESHWLLPDKGMLVSPQSAACYTTGPLAVTQYAGYENWFYCGGPGNDPIKAPLCQ